MEDGIIKKNLNALMRIDLDLGYLMGKDGNDLSQKEYHAKRQKLLAKYENIKRRLS